MLRNRIHLKYQIHLFKSRNLKSLIIHKLYHLDIFVKKNYLASELKKIYVQMDKSEGALCLVRARV